MSDDLVPCGCGRWLIGGQTPFIFECDGSVRHAPAKCAQYSDDVPAGVDGNEVAQSPAKRWRAPDKRTWARLKRRWERAS